MFTFIKRWVARWFTREPKSSIVETQVLKSTLDVCRMNLMLAERVSDKMVRHIDSKNLVMIERRLLRLPVPILEFANSTHQDHYAQLIESLSAIEQALQRDGLRIPATVLDYTVRPGTFNELTISKLGYDTPGFTIGGISLMVAKVCDLCLAKNTGDTGMAAYNRRLLFTYMRDIQQLLTAIDQAI